MMKPVTFLLLALLGAGATATASAQSNKPAPKSAAKKPNPPAKRRTYISGEDTGTVAGKGGGADTTEGWIVKRTKDGKIIKIPKKQTFRFGGTDVTGEANRPNETLLGNRLTPREATLIPERRSYRPEIMEAVGYTERTRK